MELSKMSGSLYKSLLPVLMEADEHEKPIDKMRSGLGAVQQVLIKLRLAVEKTGFKDIQAEIEFFKRQKPRIYARLVFITERYVVEDHMPLIGIEAQRIYLENQLQYVSRFFRQHEFLYQYFRMGATELDEFYFVRGKGMPGSTASEIPEVDPGFSTPVEYLFSKFIGFELLQDYLLTEIDMRTQVNSEPSGNKHQLKWTGESVNIIEMVYGIYETGQVNEGKASLNELMDFFGQGFGINLTKYFKRFSDIKRRKAMSKTRFLDEMRELVNKRIEDSDAWIPEEDRARYGYK